MKLLQRLTQTFTLPSSPPSQELTHIAQEMYKKNFELDEKNRTLSILRKIDEIILSTVTDIKEIAQHVADVVVSDAEFKAVFIFMYNKRTNELSRLALSETDIIRKARKTINHDIFRESISLETTRNIIEKSVNEHSRMVTPELTDLIFPDIPSAHLQIVKDMLQIKSSIITPLIVRGEVIGSLIVSLSENEKNLAQYQKDLIARLADVIGIALDNALLYKRIQEANEKLQQLDRTKDEFVSLASHELRTPMTVIKSYLWMTINGKGGKVSEKQRFYLDRAYKSTDRLIALVNEMLNVSRIESNRISISPKAILLDSLIREIANEMELRASELGLKIVVNIPNVLPEVLADIDKIREVIINLIGNSLKFTSPGGTITIFCKAKGGAVETDILDTGVGMTAQDIPKLFHKFGMVGDNYLTKTNAQGTGLGLYIAKSIIELHGGKIWAASSGKGKGSVFSFTLPIASKNTPESNENSYR